MDYHKLDSKRGPHACKSSYKNCVLLKDENHLELGMVYEKFILTLWLLYYSESGEYSGPPDPILCYVLCTLFSAQTSWIL